MKQRYQRRPRPPDNDASTIDPAPADAAG